MTSNMRVQVEIDLVGRDGKNFDSTNKHKAKDVLTIKDVESTGYPKVELLVGKERVMVEVAQLLAALERITGDVKCTAPHYYPYYPYFPYTYTGGQTYVAGVSGTGLLPDATGGTFSVIAGATSTPRIVFSEGQELSDEDPPQHGTAGTGVMAVGP